MVVYENLSTSNKKFFSQYKKAFADFLNSNKFVLGENVLKFEEEFAEFTHTKYCVGVGSGLAALELALVALEIPKGKEVIVPSNTYIATILAILNSGLIPVLVEPNIKTYNIDFREIRKKINKNTAVIMPVHLYGKPADMPEIMAIAREHGVKVVEDCAQSHGAMINNMPTGGLGDIGAFSFYPTKNLGALGEAGAITTNDPHIAQKIKKLRNYGSSIQYQNEIVGTNQRLDELQAAFLRIKLKHIQEIIDHKRQLAKIYLNKINNEYILPQINDNSYDVYHIFNIRHKERDRLKAFLQKYEVQTAIHYPTPPHVQPALKSMFLNQHFPLSEEIHKTTLSLPISMANSNKDVKFVAELVNKFSLEI